MLSTGIVVDFLDIGGEDIVIFVPGVSYSFHFIDREGHGRGDGTLVIGHDVSKFLVAPAD